MAAPTPTDGDDAELTPRDVWCDLLVASAYRVLKARADARKRKEQAPHDVCTMELTDARARHTEWTALIAERTQHCVERVWTTPEALACARAASNASQHEWHTRDADAACVFTGAPTRRRVVFIADDAALDGTGDTLTQSEHAVDDAAHEGRWRYWIQAAMVVGRAPVWLDGQVTAWLDAGARLNALGQIDQGTCDAMLAHRCFECLRCALNDAHRALLLITPLD